MPPSSPGGSGKCGCSFTLLPAAESGGTDYYSLRLYDHEFAAFHPLAPVPASLLYSASEMIAEKRRTTNSSTFHISDADIPSHFPRHAKERYTAALRPENFTRLVTFLLQQDAVAELVALEKQMQDFKRRERETLRLEALEREHAHTELLVQCDVLRKRAIELRLQSSNGVLGFAQLSVRLEHLQEDVDAIVEALVVVGSDPGHVERFSCTNLAANVSIVSRLRQIVSSSARRQLDIPAPSLEEKEVEQRWKNMSGLARRVGLTSRSVCLALALAELLRVKSFKTICLQFIVSNVATVAPNQSMERLGDVMAPNTFKAFCSMYEDLERETQRAMNISENNSRSSTSPQRLDRVKMLKEKLQQTRNHRARIDAAAAAAATGQVVSPVVDSTAARSNPSVLTGDCAEELKMDDEVRFHKLAVDIVEDAKRSYFRELSRTRPRMRAPQPAPRESVLQTSAISRMESRSPSPHILHSPSPKARDAFDRSSARDSVNGTEGSNSGDTIHQNPSEEAGVFEGWGDLFKSLGSESPTSTIPSELGAVKQRGRVRSATSRSRQNSRPHSPAAGDDSDVVHSARSRSPRSASGRNRPSKHQPAPEPEDLLDVASLPPPPPNAIPRPPSADPGVPAPSAIPPPPPKAAPVDMLQENNIHLDTSFKEANDDNSEENTLPEGQLKAKARVRALAAEKKRHESKQKEQKENIEKKLSALRESARRTREATAKRKPRSKSNADEHKSHRKEKHAKNGEGVAVARKRIRERRLALQKKKEAEEAARAELENEKWRKRDERLKKFKQSRTSPGPTQNPRRKSVVSTTNNNNGIEADHDETNEEVDTDGLVQPVAPMSHTVIKGDWDPVQLRKRGPTPYKNNHQSSGQYGEREGRTDWEVQPHSKHRLHLNRSDHNEKSAAAAATTALRFGPDILRASRGNGAPPSSASGEADLIPSELPCPLVAIKPQRVVPSTSAGLELDDDDASLLEQINDNLAFGDF